MFYDYLQIIVDKVVLTVYSEVIAADNTHRSYIMKTYNITPALVLAAEAMIANDMDYWPYGLIDYPSPVKEGDIDYCLYSYEDGVWLVDTNSTCDMFQAIKLVKVMSM